MKRLWWTLAQHRGAWPVALALVLLFIAGGVHGLALPALQARLDQAAARAAVPGRAQARPAEHDLAVQLRAFHRHFADGEPLSRQLARLHQVAQTHGIVLTQADYRWVAGRDAPLHEYQVLLPVKGSYTGLRHFMAAALQTLPVAALDEVSFERGRIGDPGVNANLRLTFFLPAT